MGMNKPSPPLCHPGFLAKIYVTMVEKIIRWVQTMSSKLRLEQQVVSLPSSILVDSETHRQ